MTALPPTIKGWCPSALRPMESGDGLLVRVHVTGAAIAAEAFAAIGELAKAHGNGLGDLSQRGNLQLRGVTPQSLPDLIASLSHLDLIDPEKENSVGRNVICSPMTGLDRTACFDAAALAHALEARLTGAEELRGLPDKFCFLVDDGGRFGLDSVVADIRLAGWGDRILIALANGPQTFLTVAVVDVPEAIEAALALARAFQRRRDGTVRRMQDLVQKLGAAAIAEAANIKVDHELPTLPSRNTKPQDIVGAHEGFLGVAAPYGRLNAEQMKALAAQATNGLRLTPWRSVLLPGTTPAALNALQALGLIVTPDDPRLSIVACPGHPACASAQIDTRAAAERLAPVMSCTQNGLAMHVSGCSKGCAHGADAPLTLVGREGRFDLVQNGRADDEPFMRALDLSQIEEKLKDMLCVSEAI